MDRCVAVVAGEIGFVEIWLENDDAKRARTYGFFARPAAERRLDERRQRLTLPMSHRDMPGWVGIPVDRPPPPPMPTGDDATRIIVFYWDYPGQPYDGSTLVYTVTVGVDADGNPTATVVQP